MGHGVWGDERRRQVRPSVRWWVLVAVVAGAGTLAWRTASVGTAIELVAVLGVLLGVGVAFGATEPRPRRGSGLTPPGRRACDERVAAKAAQALSSFDQIEHRRLEVGTPWPQLLIGPSGVVVVDLCPVGEVVEVDASGVRDRAGGGRPCSRCSAAMRLASMVKDALEGQQIAVPVRTVAVVAERTEIVVAPDALADICVVPVDRLADALARGPVLPMGTVDAAFELLMRTIASERLSVGNQR